MPNLYLKKCVKCERVFRAIGWEACASEDSQTAKLKLMRLVVCPTCDAVDSQPHDAPNADVGVPDGLKSGETTGVNADCGISAPTVSDDSQNLRRMPLSPISNDLHFVVVETQYSDTASTISTRVGYHDDTSFPEMVTAAVACTDYVAQVMGDLEKALRDMQYHSTALAVSVLVLKLRKCGITIGEAGAEFLRLLTEFPESESVGDADPNSDLN